MPTDRPQDYDDLLRLVATVPATAPCEPTHLAIRAELLAKLTGYVERPELSQWLGAPLYQPATTPPATGVR
jgi:hypothetical protein